MRLKVKLVSIIIIIILCMEYKMSFHCTQIPGNICQVQNAFSLYTNKYWAIYRVIQEESAIFLGNDSMRDSKQKSSYKHVSDFRRLWSYGHFLIPVHALMWTAVAGLSCAFRVHFERRIPQHRELPRAQFTTERQPVLRAAVAFSKTSIKHRSVQIKGNFTKLTLHLYFKCIMYYAGLLFCSVCCQ
jgi:hypothetical protein